MIQRIQSLYLALLVILQIAISRFGFINFSRESRNFELNINGIYLDGEVAIMEDKKHLLLLVISIIVAVITIFLFKNRKLQSKLCKLVTFIALIQIGYIATSFYRLNDAAIENISLGLSSYLVVIVAILSILAARSIKKDEDLVKSVDRIR